ncbi:transcriptional regulator [Methylophaga sp. 41_12_T18]|nr:transcriptional regulator [Methylophaga sp. 41_12_T18]
MAEQEETLIEFPCDFDVKAMGPSSEDFDAIVVDIIRHHVDDIKEGAVTTKQSSGGKFTSVTVTIYATSKAQIDAIYRELSAHEQVKYVL